jgi:hypothetical protein
MFGHLFCLVFDRLLRKRNPNFLVAAGLPDDNGAVARLEAATKASTKGAMTFLRRLELHTVTGESEHQGA